MVAAPEVLAIIPARGGSKSIPGKNIKPLAGVPLIAYSIAAGLQAETVTRVIVSTDSEEIAEVAGRYGAEIPFLRPAEFAQDDTPDLPVFQHALEWLRDHEGYQPAAVVQLRATSPFRPLSCVDDGVRLLLNDPAADSVRAVMYSGENPFKMWRPDPDSPYLQPLLQVDGIAEPYNAPRQKLPTTYWQTGHLDVMRPATILEKNSMSGERIRALLIDGRYAVDIDTPLDWAQAEQMMVEQPVPFVRPPEAALLDDVRLLVLDFDGVMTDDRVWVAEDGREMVAANRSDGMGIALARAQGVEVMVLSREENPVVSARCRKLGIECIQGLLEKESTLRQIVAARGLDWSQVVYLGNDVNDIGCLRLAGCAAVVADAHPGAKAEADLILSYRGGHGAVRELCDRIVMQKRKGQHA